MPDPNSTTNPEFKIVLSIIAETLKKARTRAPCKVVLVFVRRLCGAAGAAGWLAGGATAHRP